MVFNDSPILRTVDRLLLRYVGLTEENLLEFSVLSGFNNSYGVVRSPIVTDETLFLANVADITSLLRHPLDIIYIFGEFEVLQNFKVNVTDLHTCFYFENFCWQLMPCKLVLNT